MIAEIEHCTPDGAARLKRRIEDYWTKREQRVRVTIVPGRFTPALRSARMDVRSDMVNGLPVPALAAVPARAAPTLQGRGR